MALILYGSKLTAQFGDEHQQLPVPGHPRRLLGPAPGDHLFTTRHRAASAGCQLLADKLCTRPRAAHLAMAPHSRLYLGRDAEPDREARMEVLDVAVGAALTPERGGCLDLSTGRRLRGEWRMRARQRPIGAIPIDHGSRRATGASPPTRAAGRRASSRSSAGCRPRSTPSPSPTRSAPQDMQLNFPAATMFDARGHGDLDWAPEVHRRRRDLDRRRCRPPTAPALADARGWPGRATSSGSPRPATGWACS